MGLVEKYIERLQDAWDNGGLSAMNDIIEEAANDDRITNDDYQTVYAAGMDIVANYG